MAFIVLSSAAQDSMVRVYGKVLSEKDSTPVHGSILYEKLPYYDDMGIAGTQVDGSFEMYLVNNTSYNFRIENVNGFEPFLAENTVQTAEGNSNFELNLFVKAIEEEVEELITLDNLNFARAKAEITKSSYTGLDEFIDYIKGKPNVNIQLEGHTDFAGNADANMRLSQARVDAVAEYLVKNGIKKNKVTTKAFGGTQPITQERTDEARARNRRVEVRLTRQN
ncbi:MAG: OmpA family protein [Cyclobacteriaceae bacterium]